MTNQAQPKNKIRITKQNKALSRVLDDISRYTERQRVNFQKHRGKVDDARKV